MIGSNQYLYTGDKNKYEKLVFAKTTNQVAYRDELNLSSGQSKETSCKGGFNFYIQFKIKYLKICMYNL